MRSPHGTSVGSPERARPHRGRDRRGVLLLVVLSMLTLFMLLGVTYLVLAARTRATSRAFLKLEDDLSANSIKVKPLVREAALQVIRGTQNARSAIRFHDLLGDKYAGSTVVTIQAAALVATGDMLNPVGPAGQLLRLHIGTSADPSWTGSVVTFLDGPPGVKLTSGRIAEAATLTIAGSPYGFIWVPRPEGLVSKTVPAMQLELQKLVGKAVLVNRRDFAGAGFSASATPTGTGNTLLNDGALSPNRSLGFSTTFDSVGYTNAGLDGTAPNEDYDAVDEQNMALGRADQSDQSFMRPRLFDLWLRDYARRSGGGFASQADAATDLLQAHHLSGRGLAAFTDSSNTQQVAQAVALHQLRRASLRPFAFDHYQNDGSAADRDFAGRSLASLSAALFPTQAGGRPLGDVDNDGDGIKESVWLDLGMGVTQLGDGKRVKPLFAIHCIDLGGRVSLNAHGSPAHAAEQNILGNANFAPRRDGGPPQGPTRLRGGLGYGPADVRLDAVLSQAGQEAVMFGLANPSTPQNSAFGVRRDIPAIVGRYGDGIGDGGAPALPGVPGQNDRRMTADRRTWTDRGLPLSWIRNNPPDAAHELFAGGPPDTWSRLAVGVDHRGQPFYASRTTMPTTITVDNPYELDLVRSRQGVPYLQLASGPNDRSLYTDQPFTATELESILRPYDSDIAMATSPRLLALMMATAGDPATFNRWRQSVTTDLWDTPAIVGLPTPSGKHHDPDLTVGLKMDLNRPFGDGADSDGDMIVDEPGETGDPYGGTFTTLSGTSGYVLTRGPLPLGTGDDEMPIQPGADEPHLRARQLFAFQIYSLLKHVRTHVETGVGGLRLFAVRRDVTAGGDPVAVDSELNSGPNAGDNADQRKANEQSLAQWAINVVDFLDPDAIMTPFRFKQPTSSPPDPANEFVVWGCEHPDVMITETLAFHDRRTADTKADPTGETTTNFRAQYATVYAAWQADQTKPKPDPNDPDNNPDTDDPDFDQVRIPEGSLFLELHGLRNPNLPNLPQELYSFDPTTNAWYLDVGRVPTGGVDPVWRLAITKPRAADVANDVFKRLAENPDTTPLTSGTNPGKVADLFPIDRYVWLSATAPPATATVPGSGPTLDNTYYRRGGATTPRLKPGGYLVVGPRQTTAIGSIDNSALTTGQKWGVPSKQQIVLDDTGSGAAVVVTDLEGAPNPGVDKTTVSGTLGNPVPPASLPETTATWVSMAPPTTWSGNANVPIGLNVSEPLRNAYYPEPTVSNPRSGFRDAYGPLDSETHTQFLRTPVDQSGTPLSENLLSGGSFANYCAVFVERLADPTRPHEPDATSANWNPYVVVDFMPVDLTVFNGESRTPDPSETQGADRDPEFFLDAPFGELPVRGTAPPTTPPEPAKVPLPFASSAVLSRRHTYFHSRQRGFGYDLPDYANNRTLFNAGPGQVRRNPHPFKQIGSLDDLKNTPLTRSGTAAPQQPGGLATTSRTGLAAADTACFLHELGQGKAGRTAGNWNSVPYHSLGWVNSSFGRRLEATDGIPASYTGVPDRPFPWLAWNDRPFMNVAELALVPRTSPGRLLSNYRNLDYPGGVDYVTTGTSGTTSTYNSNDFFGACGPGAHLLPLTPLTDGIPPGPSSGPPLTRRRNADVLGGLFEYVRVRSPFVGTEIVISGSAVAQDGRPDRFVGPFNRVSRYREPGRVNINTLPTDATTGRPVWEAVCGVENGTAAPAVPGFADIISSGTMPLPFSSGTTAVFNRPFRPFRRTSGSFESDGFASNTLFPQSLLRNPPTGDPTGWYVTGTATPTIEDRFTSRSFTLLRDKPIVSGTAQPLFPPDLPVPPNLPDAWANDPNRNAWFRFNTLARAMANTTHRSETYAIWVTMGFFEVASVPESSNPADVAKTYLWDPDPAMTVKRYPDGYRLVREYGSDTGDVTRHRGFYILDRSIPVGYERGKDHNVDDAILVERFLE